jgi:hypothetical protein
LLVFGYGSIGICRATVVPIEPLGQYQVVIFYRGSSGPEGDLPGAWLLVQAFYPSRLRVSRRDGDEAQLTGITGQPPVHRQGPTQAAGPRPGFRPA